MKTRGCFNLLTLAAIVFALPVLVLAQRHNFDVENLGLECNVTHGALLSGTGSSVLPNPFAMNDGTVITTKEEWACRRNEIKKNLEFYEIGPKPDPSTSTVNATLTGNELSVRITTASGSITLTSTVSGSGECVAIGMNGNANNISGCRQIPFRHDQVVAYEMNGTVNLNDPFYTVYPELRNRMGKYGAWSWGISRLIDGIEQVKDQLGVNMARIGVQGCSYAGKMALFAGALDERITLTVVQESGGGGINSWRTSQDFASRAGNPDIEKINNTSTSWFLSSMRNLNPNRLPHDHHELIALIAPRAVIALGNPGWTWLGDESGYKSIVAASEVWKAFGVPENIGYDFRPANTHCQASTGQASSVTAFVNRFLRGQTANTDITIAPRASDFNGQDVRTVDLTVGAGVINWTTPTLIGTYGNIGTGPSGFILSTNVTPANAGTITLDPVQPANGRYDEGTQVSVTQTPTANWEFIGWSGACTNTGSCMVTMSKNETVTAMYKRPDGFIDTTNLIRNGTFANTQYWTLNEWSGSATFGVSGGNANITAITSASTAANHSLQLIQNGIPLTQGLAYTLTFEASAASARTMGVVVEMDVDPWTSYSTPETINLTSAKQTFTHTFTMTNPSDDNSRVSFNTGGATPNVQISNVRLVQVAPGSSSIRNVSATGINQRTSNLRATAAPNAINVSFRALGTGTTTIKLYNLKGGLILSEKINTIAGTNYLHKLNPGKLPAGFYIAEKHGGGRVEQVRVIMPK